MYVYDTVYGTVERYRAQCSSDNSTRAGAELNKQGLYTKKSSVTAILIEQSQQGSVATVPELILISDKYQPSTGLMR